MSFHDEAVRACREVGLGFRCTYDRGVPQFEIELDDDGGGGCALSLRLRDEDVEVCVLDVDPSRGGIVLELSVKTVEHEPSFGLWLDGLDRRRYLAIGGDAGWQLRRVEATTVAEAIDRDGDDGRR